MVGRVGGFYIWTTRLIFSEEFHLIFRSVQPGDCWSWGWTGRRESAEPRPVATLTTGDNGKASDSLEIIFHHHHH